MFDLKADLLGRQFSAGRIDSWVNRSNPDQARPDTISEYFYTTQDNYEAQQIPLKA